ncbi:MAG: hypothetical protein KC619_33770 [Myxococcales bacterium]|nr:hypothetical protein [Myxococcales bacterium]
MRVPSRTYRLAPSATVTDRDVDLEAWQAHVISHPFGLETIRRGTRVEGVRRWNHEGWDRLDPPLLTEARRIQLTGAIRQLRDGGRRCGVDELETLETDHPWATSRVACYGCGPVLTQACADQLVEVGRAYAAFVDDTLAHLEDAVVIPRRELPAAIERCRFSDDVPVVGTLGELRGDNAWGLRFNRPDGVRVEVREDGDTFFWRTTYRNRVDRWADVRAHLLSHLAGHDPDDELSGKALVPRPWRERNPS